MKGLSKMQESPFFMDAAGIAAPDGYRAWLVAVIDSSFRELPYPMREPIAPGVISFGRAGPASGA